MSICYYNNNCTNNPTRYTTMNHQQLFTKSFIVQLYKHLAALIFALIAFANSWTPFRTPQLIKHYRSVYIHSWCCVTGRHPATPCQRHNTENFIITTGNANNAASFISWLIDNEVTEIYIIDKLKYIFISKHTTNVITACICRRLLLYFQKICLENYLMTNYS